MTLELICVFEPFRVRDNRYRFSDPKPTLWFGCSLTKGSLKLCPKNSEKGILNFDCLREIEGEAR